EQVADSLGHHVAVGALVRDVPVGHEREQGERGDRGVPPRPVPLLLLLHPGKGPVDGLAGLLVHLRLVLVLCGGVVVPVPGRGRRGRGPGRGRGTWGRGTGRRRRRGVRIAWEPPAGWATRTDRSGRTAGPRVGWFDPRALG